MLSLNLATLASSVSLNEKWSHSLEHLNALSPIGGVILGILGAAVSLEEAHHM